MQPAAPSEPHNAYELSSVPGPAAIAHLGRVVDELQGRVAGNHGAQIGERAGGVQPAVRAVRPDGVEETDHCRESREEEKRQSCDGAQRGQSRTARGAQPAAPPDSRSLAKAALMTHWMKTRLSANVNFSCRAPSPYFPRVLQRRDAVRRRRGARNPPSPGPTPRRGRPLTCSPAGCRSRSSRRRRPGSRRAGGGARAARGRPRSLPWWRRGRSAPGPRPRPHRAARPAAAAERAASYAHPAPGRRAGPARPGLARPPRCRTRGAAGGGRAARDAEQNHPGGAEQNLSRPLRGRCRRGSATIAAAGTSGDRQCAGQPRAGGLRRALRRR